MLRRMPQPFPLWIPRQTGTSNVGICAGASAPLGNFQFAGRVTIIIWGIIQYCTMSSAPAANAASLIVLNPQQIGATSVGACGKNTAVYSGYQLGAGYAIATSKTWQIFNSGFSPAQNIFVMLSRAMTAPPGRVHHRFAPFLPLRPWCES